MLQFDVTKQMFCVEEMAKQIDDLLLFECVEEKGLRWHGLLISATE